MKFFLTQFGELAMKTALTVSTVNRVNVGSSVMSKDNIICPVESHIKVTVVIV